MSLRSAAATGTHDFSARIHIQKNSYSGKARWKEQGIRPDYRFSLANERTFLAWIRTALALLAGAVGLEQLVNHTGSGSHWHSLSLILAAGAAFLSVMGWLRWRENEIAMRNERDLNYSNVLLTLSCYLLGIVLFVMFLIFR